MKNKPRRLLVTLVFKNTPLDLGPYKYLSKMIITPDQGQNSVPEILKVFWLLFIEYKQIQSLKQSILVLLVLQWKKRL